ncbi:MAG: AbrB family transcriptional regulator [Rhodobacteraceae bacterium]|nr:AbrB family transcriptional regulator [Paracoccaceae bacterium]
MSFQIPTSQPILTITTLAIGAIGAALAYALSLPASVLIGPAIAVSLTSLVGLRMEISTLARDACFVLLGLGIGAGFDAQATAAILRWPLAFLIMAIMLVAIIQICSVILIRFFGFERRSAILSAAPGHLSYVLGLASDLKGDVGRVAVVQTIRLLALSVSVPFVALAMGYEMSPVAMAGGTPMSLWHILVLVLAAIVLGAVLKRLNMPAPLLLGAMAASSLSHATELTPGGMPIWLMTPAFLVLGTLIGTRFSGMSLASFRASLMAGLTTTVVAVALAGLAAVPVAWALGMPVPHVLAAFSPGGLETMVAMSATMGASPGFVAACHVIRLLILTVLIPISLGRQRQYQA